MEFILLLRNFNAYIIPTVSMWRCMYQEIDIKRVI